MLKETAISMLVLMTAGWSCDGARILALVPIQARSHWIIMEPLFQELASRGHQLTVYSTFPQDPPLANYTDVDLSPQLPQISSILSLDVLVKEIPHAWSILTFVSNIHIATCRVLEDKLLKDLQKSKGQYDVLITELFGSDCYAYYAHKLGVPLISIVTTPGSPWAADRTGMPDNPSYIPNVFLDFDHYMTFWQRVYNTVYMVYAKWLYYFRYAKQTQDIAEKSFGEPLPAISDVVSKTSLLLVNSHFSLIQSRPFPPNVVEIGGIHIKDKKPLEKDLKTILDNATSGAIIVSFGSLVRASTLPKSTIVSFMKAFSKIPQTVIFKYEEDLPEVPTNVIIRKWLPQRDLLEHKNAVAAIIHGGLASTIEVVHIGKPIIGIPFFGDQSLNIMNIVRRGAGVLLELKDVSEENVSRSLREVLNNPKYAENMKRLSMQFRDRPLTALQSAVYWTEYVIRHGGAPQLRPASVDLPLYQYLLLDVIAVLATALAVLLFALYRTAVLIIYLVTAKRKQQRNNDRKKTN